MHDPTSSDEISSPVRSLRDRLGGNAEERLGRALSELLESPLFTGAIGRAFDAREKAAQAQEVALGALNLPSAADIERLTRRIRSLSQRLEAIEDGVERLDSTRLAERRVPLELEARLEHVEQQLDGLVGKLDLVLERIQRAAERSAGAGTSTAPRTGARSDTATAPRGTAGAATAPRGTAGPKRKAAGAKRKAAGATGKAAAGSARKAVAGPAPKAASAKPTAGGARRKG